MTQVFYMDIHQSQIKKKKRLEGSYVTINEAGLRSINPWNSKKRKFYF